MGKDPNAGICATSRDSVQLLALDLLHSMLCCRIQTHVRQEFSNVQLARLR
jgi:hypothetical protein